MNKTFVSAAVAAATVLVLTGCSAEDPNFDELPAPDDPRLTTETETPEPTASPEPEVEFIEWPSKLESADHVTQTAEHFAWGTRHSRDEPYELTLATVEGEILETRKIGEGGELVLTCAPELVSTPEGDVWVYVTDRKGEAQGLESASRSTVAVVESLDGEILWEKEAYAPEPGSDLYCNDDRSSGNLGSSNDGRWVVMSDVVVDMVERDAWELSGGQAWPEGFVADKKHESYFAGNYIMTSNRIYDLKSREHTPAWMLDNHEEHDALDPWFRHGEVTRPHLLDFAVPSPTLDGIIYGRAGDYYLATSVADGEILWKRDVPESYENRYVDPSGKYIVISGNNYGVGALDAATGNQVWRVEHEGQSYIKALFVNEHYVLVSVNDQAALLDIRTGEQVAFDPEGDVWSTEISAGRGGLVSIGSGGILIPTAAMEALLTPEAVQ